jgi:hypothetical protein
MILFNHSVMPLKNPLDRYKQYINLHKLGVQVNSINSKNLDKALIKHNYQVVMIVMEFDKTLRS